MERIVFGTSGWRGVLGEDFTFANIRRVVQAIADHVVAQGAKNKGLIVGYDPRFMGKMFAEEAARLVAQSGIPVYLCDRDTPTPVISHAILQGGAAGAINFTASHNPYEYNGIKFSPAWGGPALPETTGDIERRANQLPALQAGSMYENRGTVAEIALIDPRPAYLASLENKVDFEAVAQLGTIAVNPMYGAGRGYLDEPFVRSHIPVHFINNYSDPYFGGYPPEPAERYMADFIDLVKKTPQIRLGIATDGDADRFGIVDADGTYIEPNYILALLLDYLVRTRGGDGGVARSIATSHLVDAVAAKHGIVVYETPVGFKYIGELISNDKILIGGEESAGLSIKGHVPEKDGILACFLVAEMVAREGMSLGEQLERLYAQVGRFVTRRENVRLSPELDAGFAHKMSSLPAEFAGAAVREVITIDGTKCILEGGSWLLFRKSGTEPVVRLYGEASSEEQLVKILAAGKTFICG
jgi:phosphoglucomutase